VRAPWLETSEIVEDFRFGFTGIPSLFATYLARFLDDLALLLKSPLAAQICLDAFGIGRVESAVEYE